MLEWTIDNGCNLIISAAAIPFRNDVQDDGYDMYVDNTISSDTKPSVYTVSSTESAAKKISEVSFSHLRSGAVTGIPGILLNEGALTGLDVIVLIVNLAKNTQDFHAAAVISEAISKIVPGIYCDTGSMIADAQLDENRIKNIRNSQSKSDFHVDICTGKNLKSRINLIHRCCRIAPHIKI